MVLKCTENNASVRRNVLLMLCLIYFGPVWILPMAMTCFKGATGALLLGTCVKLNCHLN